MNVEILARRLAPILPLLRCPRCAAPFALRGGRSLVCESGHCFDLSAKGYVNFAPGHDQRADPYDSALFESRARVFADGFYAPVAGALCDMAERLAGGAARSEGEAPLFLDAGCGEGYYARALAKSPLRPTVAGLDISRDAIQAAARQAPDLHWFVADLTKLPFRDASADAVIDVLTPADYRAFARVLKPGGILCKVVPADDYLAEIRSAVEGILRSEGFSNARVVEHMRAHAEIVEHRTVRRMWPLTRRQAEDFWRMTPLTFGLRDVPPPETLTQITVAMELYACRLSGTDGTA